MWTHLIHVPDRAAQAKLLLQIVGALVLGTGTFSSALAKLHVSPPIPIAGGTMIVIFDPADPLDDVLVHFHGAARTMADNFRDSGLACTLVVVSFSGLSSAYAKPFRSEPRLFAQLLERALSYRREHGAAAEQAWRRVAVSTFSAGFGAVRQILKSPADFDRIDCILAADSIYAGLEAETPERRVSEANMRDFRRFAKCAAGGTKTFLVTHSYLETPYASTFETADDLIQAVGIQRTNPTPAESDEEPLVLRSLARRGQFRVFGYAGDDGPAHMEHLRNIGHWWRQLPLAGNRPPTPDSP